MVRMLLVEDDPLYAELIRQMSSRSRKITYDLFHADTLSKGLQCLQDGHFDVILADLGLPDSSGLNTLRSVLGAAKSIPVIVLTGSADEETEIGALREGAQDYLLKHQVNEPLLTRSILNAMERKVAENSLIQSESNTRSIIENAPLPIFVAAISDGRILLANRRVAELFGLEDGKAAGIPLTQYFDDKNFRVTLYSHLMEKGIYDGMEASLKKVTGERICVLLSVVLSHFQGEDVLIASFSDITERKRVEDLYRMLSDKSVAGVYVVQDGVFKYLNDNAASFAGYRPEELIGRVSTTLIHPEDRDAVRMDGIEMVKGTRKTPREFRIVDKAGGIRWIMETVTIIPYEGRPAILGNSMNITQLKEAQKQLKQMEALESSVLAAIPHAVLGFENRAVIFANDNVESVFGRKPGELVGKDLATLFAHQADCEKFIRQLQTELQARGVYDEEPGYPLTHRDGRPLDCRVTAARIGDGTGNGFVLTFEDISDRKKAQLQLLQSEKMASIGQLAAGVAHEINNPTGYVSSNLKTMSEYFDGIMGILERYRQFLSDVRELVQTAKGNGTLTARMEEIAALEQKLDIDYILKDAPDLIRESREGADRIKEIVLSLKNFAHPGEDKFAYSDINKNLDSTLNVVWNELKYKVTITKEYGELPDVRCNPQQLNQVFMNILVNAAQAIKVKGEIFIRTKAVDDRVEISISDTGSGIPKENLPKIFDPFFTTKAVGKGTGLGLNVAYNIIKKHHGAIEVNSEVGRGTTFTIHVPIEQLGPDEK